MPETREIEEVRAILKSIPEEDRCDPKCLGYIISDAGNGPQIERCDECCGHLPDDKYLNDCDVSQLPEAQELLAKELELGDDILEDSLAPSHAIASKADVILSVSPALWDDDRVQFARLLCELVANWFDDMSAGDVIKSTAESMDLSVGEVNELFDRAEKVWEEAKKKVICELSK